MSSAYQACVIAISVSLAACAPMGGPGGRGETGGHPGVPGASGAGHGGAPGANGASLVIVNLQHQLRQTAEALRLTPAQAVLWDAYQEKLGALMADQMKLPPYSASRQPAPQQIARKLDVVRNRLAAMEEIQDAAGKLYAALDEKQRSTADQMLPATVPALYSGLGGAAGAEGERRADRPGARGSMGGGMEERMGGPGNGFGR